MDLLETEEVHVSCVCAVFSGIAIGGPGGGGRVPPLTVKNLPNIGKEGKNQGKRGKSRRKGKNREGSFTLPHLTDRAGYWQYFAMRGSPFGSWC